MGQVLAEEPVSKGDAFTLLDMGLVHWETFIGVPKPSVAIDGYQKTLNPKNGVAVGLNDDPTKVFSVTEVDGLPVLRVSGEIDGALTSIDAFENYHLSLEYKWGQELSKNAVAKGRVLLPPGSTAKPEPVKASQPGSGILYHSTGEFGAISNAWMRGLEFPLDHGAAGEKPRGEWNTLEILTIGSRVVHVLNQQVVLVLDKARQGADDKKGAPLSAGKIQIQSEGAEIFYRNIKIRAIQEIPESYLKK
jgi:Domain of Unknown Function (DUF1080)